MKAKKALVVLTSFWDADLLIHGKEFLFTYKDCAYRVALEGNNHTVYSIALSNPSFSKFKHIKNMEKLWFWCPTYNILRDYHEDKDWVRYTDRYKELLRERKEDIKQWINSLSPDHVYILCCWENTNKGAHCHRQIMHNALLNSKIAKEKLFPIYRDGFNKREGENKLQTQNDEDSVNNTDIPYSTFTLAPSPITTLDMGGTTIVATSPNRGGDAFEDVSENLFGDPPVSTPVSSNMRVFNRDDVDGLLNDVFIPDTNDNDDDSDLPF